MSGSTRYCTFSVDERLFGVPVTEVQEVVREQVMTRVPLSPAAVRGLINLRGQIVTAIDLRQRLGLPAGPDHPASLNLLVRTAEGPVSLLVDRMEDVVELDDACLAAAPSTLTALDRRCVRGIAQLPGRLLLLLRLGPLLDLRATPTPGPITN